MRRAAAMPLAAALTLTSHLPAEASMFGLSWGADSDAVKERFPGVAPAADQPHALVYVLGSVADKLWNEGAFCPTAICSGPGRADDEVVFNFAGDGLAAVFVRFGYAFEIIGQDPDTLSELAMAGIARAEFQQLLFEFSSRYGAPEYVTHETMRSGKLHAIGAALFDAGDGAMAHVLFGHDMGSLSGELRYQRPSGDRRGF